MYIENQKNSRGIGGLRGWAGPAEQGVPGAEVLEFKDEKTQVDFRFDGIFHFRGDRK